MSRIQIVPLTQWITEAALQHGSSLPAHLMQRLAINRRQAGQLLKKLVVLQWLNAMGTPRIPLYGPGALRQVVRRYTLARLQEGGAWRRDFAAAFTLPAAVQRMAQHAFTELLNNAVDHSGGSSVTVSMRQTPLQLQLLVSDDGCGLFDRIAQSFHVDEPIAAMLELSKGKLTSAPERHSGHGLFFTSRLADVCDIHANKAHFQCWASDGSAWRVGRPGPVAARSGTSVYLAMALDTPRTLDAVLQAHSRSGEGYDFSRTRVPLKLLASDDSVLASRADARRVASGLQRFASAEIDFDGIDDIGHGFADELFRVFGRSQSALTLLPVGMAPRVAAMVGSVQHG